MSSEDTSPARPGVSRFDAAAATWDQSPVHRDRTCAIARAIRQDLRLQRTWRVLEYGCGTAALGFDLAADVAEVVAADASPGMIEQVRRKVAQRPGVRLTPWLLDLGRQDPPAERFDLIVTAMAMHHVEDLDTLWSRLAGMLTPTGAVAVADLCLEDGSFHAPERVPHHGFEPERLAETLQRHLGPASYRWRVIYQMPKNNRHYEVFLLTVFRSEGR